MPEKKEDCPRGDFRPLIATEELPIGGGLGHWAIIIIIIMPIIIPYIYL
ncbi:MAG: hypothetical protein ABOK23_09865 [Candidatus Methanoperedens sp.]|nr:hypothetical protein [Candidatus Methanoperedens sp.]MCZ7396737.1 hypothetical protein [Candidatus Methanoperedens sp.]